MKVSQKLSQSFKELGVDYDLELFADRKRLQKLTYLLETVGIDLGFKFSWYLHGPYSPSLTRVLYKKDKEEMNRTVPDNKNDNKKIVYLKKFLGRDINSSNTLELIVSLHYITLLGKAEKMSDEEIIKLFLKLKPFFSENETRFYYEQIHNLMVQRPS